MGQFFLSAVQQATFLCIQLYTLSLYPTFEYKSKFLETPLLQTSDRMYIFSVCLI